MKPDRRKPVRIASLGMSRPEAGEAVTKTRAAEGVIFGGIGNLQGISGWWGQDFGELSRAVSPWPFPGSQDETQFVPTNVVLRATVQERCPLPAGAAGGRVLGRPKRGPHTRRGDVGTCGK
jgi:hypothetical protein